MRLEICWLHSFRNALSKPAEPGSLFISAVCSELEVPLWALAPGDRRAGNEFPQQQPAGPSVKMLPLLNGLP